MINDIILPYLSHNGCNNVQYSMHRQQEVSWKGHVGTPPRLTSKVLLATIGILFVHQIRSLALPKQLLEESFLGPIFLTNIHHWQQVLHKPKNNIPLRILLKM